MEANAGDGAMRRTASRFMAIVVLWVSLATPPVAARQVEGVRFPQRVDVGGTALELNCAALLRYMVFIKAYVAALYLGDGVAPEAVLADVPKRLEINYFHAITAAQFVTATTSTIGANTDAATLAALRPRLERFNQLYVDVQPGDRYAITYLPGVGTELSLNGQPRGVVEGPDFARAMFAIWLGDKPLDVALKEGLLECS